ncbi:hypothetical protein BDD12DRAFT_809182 [Trichophaea hybrida]|nr:hypothetical protein BDD12DRAFT_809182 [Trichophaea hybrida]
MKLRSKLCYKIRGPQKVGERRTPPSRLRVRLKVRGIRSRDFLRRKFGRDLREQLARISVLKVLMSGASRRRRNKDFQLCNAHLDRNLEASPVRSAVAAGKVLYDDWVAAQTLFEEPACKGMDEAQREAFLRSWYPNGYKAIKPYPRTVQSESLLERRRNKKAVRVNVESSDS